MILWVICILRLRLTSNSITYKLFSIFDIKYLLFYDNLHILKEKDKLSFNYNKKKYENYVLSMYLKKKQKVTVWSIIRIRLLNGLKLCQYIYIYIYVTYWLYTIISNYFNYVYIYPQVIFIYLFV